MISEINFLRRKLIWFPAFIIFLFCFLTKPIKAEEPEEALKKINERMEFIKIASDKFNINYKILSAIIYVERTLNYDWRDDALDVIIAEAGMNSSIGFCQVKLKTAYWIEKQLNTSESIYNPGNQYKGILKISTSPEELILKLTNDSLNIFYAAAYIRIIQSRWEKEGFLLDDKPEIIGTLYSTGLFYRDGKERTPRMNPDANGFGKKVKNAVSFFRK